MKFHITHFLILLFAAICALGLIAAAPHQTPLPPTATPAVVVTAPPVDVLGNIIDQIAGVLITALIAAVAWLIAQVQTLKQQGVSVTRSVTPDNWEWIVEAEAAIFVRAARQLYPPEQTAKMLGYVQDALFTTLKDNKIPITDAVKDKVRAIIEAAVFDLYAEFPEAKPSAK